MPLHVAPAIRALEEVREEAGLLQVQDSVGVTIQKTLESLGQVAKPVVYKTYYHQNVVVKQR